MKQFASTAWLLTKLFVGSFVLPFFVILASLPGLANAAASKETCQARDFSVKVNRMSREYDKVVFVGTVTSRAPIACGVQLKATLFDKSDEALDVMDFWPTSVRNIQPGSIETFKVHMPYNKLAKTYTMLPIDTRVWSR